MSGWWEVWLYSCYLSYSIVVYAGSDNRRCGDLRQERPLFSFTVVIRHHLSAMRPVSGSITVFDIQIRTALCDCCEYLTYGENSYPFPRMLLAWRTDICFTMASRRWPRKVTGCDAKKCRESYSPALP